MNCFKCNTPLVSISREVLEEIKKKIKPTFCSPNSEDFKKEASQYNICPQCDSYALGLELKEGFSFQDQNGNAFTIQSWIQQNKNT